jgi:hypothetical protein
MKEKMAQCVWSESWKLKLMLEEYCRYYDDLVFITLLFLLSGSLGQDGQVSLKCKQDITPVLTCSLPGV